jgi:hypothetical protein
VNTIKNVAGQLGWPAILTPPVTPQLTAEQFAGVITTQIDDELRWSKLVSSIAPLCRQDLLFRGIPTAATTPPTDPIAKLLRAAISDITNRTGPATFLGGGPIKFRDIKLAFDLPPPVATSLESIASKM